MNECARCEHEYPGHEPGCPLDQRSETENTPPPQDAGIFPDLRFRNQVLIPGLLWLVVYFFLSGVFTIGAGFLFGLGTATWAAIDSSKLQARGSRILGLAFKPVVVFGVCAFFLWGLGFIWYLIMRHRIQTSPVRFENEPAETAT